MAERPLSAAWFLRIPADSHHGGIIPGNVLLAFSVE